LSKLFLEKLLYRKLQLSQKREGGKETQEQTKERRICMNEDQIAQLNLFSALAMHALITRATKMNMDSRELAVRAVDIAEELIVETGSARAMADLRMSKMK